MQATKRYNDALPLEGKSGFSRRIYIDSAKIDESHIQMRGELVDQRADYQDEDQAHNVHGMVVRLSFNVKTRLITQSEMALPQMAFKGICVEQMPAKAEELLGASVDSGFSQKIAEVFGSTRGCMHVMTLYRALALAMTQISSWNSAFRQLDEGLDPKDLKVAMDMVHSTILNSCHAWQEGSGGASQDFYNEDYGPMLQRCTPKLLGRWKQYKDAAE